MPRPIRSRRWSFRTRLTVALALIFAVSGSVLVLTQHLILNTVFGVTTDRIVTTYDEPSTGPAGTMSEEEAAMRAALETAHSTVVKDVTNNVLAEMMLWSLGLMAVFALVAWFVSWLVVRRAMKRVHRVSETARRITEQDLTRRLNLPGPEDEIKELGDTIDSMLARLQSSFEAQSRFISNASHELRTPLTATRLTLEVPLEQNRVSESARPIIERALKTTRRSERLVESLLTLVRDPATLMGEATEVPLDGLCVSVLEDADPAAQAHGVAMQSDLDAVVVRGVPELLRQMVENLVDNAIAHNHRGGSVAVALERSRQHAVLTVSSTGEALDRVAVEGLRRPFERGSRTAHRGGAVMCPGLGLGLSIVESIVTAHNGGLSLEPNADGGLIASVRLPGPDAVRAPDPDEAAALRRRDAVG